MPDTKFVFFDDVTRNASVMTKNIRLHSGNGKPIIITEVYIPDAPYLTCNPQKDGNDVILNINFNGQLIPEQRFQGTDTLTVHTTNKIVPALHFFVSWDMRSDSEAHLW